MNMNLPEDEALWTGLAFRLLVNTVSHPIEYAKVLIQIGYEPLEPRPTTTLFNKPALGLPNVLQYVKYIKYESGLAGCYCGLIPKLCAYTVCAIVFEKTYKCITFSDEERKENVDEIEDESKRRKKCIYELIRDLISKMTAIIVSHPLDVITWRMMAQFVGSETKYNGLFRSFAEVYRENGIMGYYAGLVPRLIGNAAVLILVSSSTYVINKYIISDSDMRSHTVSTMTYLASTITYPFLLVSHCMAVNNCGLAAGLPPRMPIYNSWLDCWSHLSLNNQLKRGSTLFWRYYTGPQVTINGKLRAIGTDSFFLETMK